MLFVLSDFADVIQSGPDGSEQAKDWVREKWDKVKKGMAFALAKVDETGLLKVTLPAGWGRNLLVGHNLEGNCSLHYVLRQFSQLARDVAGDYIDAPVHPQDGNTLALWYDVVASSARAARISLGLTASWSAFGPVAPESPQMVSSFCSSMELVAHYAAGRPDRALALLRTM